MKLRFVSPSFETCLAAVRNLSEHGVNASGRWLPGESRCPQWLVEGVEKMRALPPPSPEEAEKARQAMERLRRELAGITRFF